MSTPPPVVHNPNDFSSSSNNPSPTPPKNSGNYIVGCFGILLLGFVILFGLAAFIFQRHARSGNEALTKSRPDVGRSSSMPPSLRRAISSSAAQSTAAPRKWTKADARKLQTLVSLIESASEDIVDARRLVVEMGRIEPGTIMPFTESLWTNNLQDSIGTPELFGSVKCIDAQWINENEARAIFCASNYGLPTLVIAYIHESDGEFKIYDWRETLEPMSEAEYWAHFSVADEPECYAFGELSFELDDIYYDEELDESERPARLLNAFSLAQIPSEFLPLAQHTTATYLYFLENSDEEIRSVVAEMIPSQFAGAYLWQARLIQESEPEQAFNLAMKALDAVGWHPAATDIALKTVSGGEQILRASPWIAQSLQHDILTNNQLLLDQEPNLLNSVVEQLYARCSSDDASQCIMRLLGKDSYASKAALLNIDAALTDVPATRLLKAYVAYRKAKVADSPEAVFDTLTELIRHKLPNDLEDTLLEQYFSNALETKNLRIGLDQIRSTGLYEAEFIDNELAKTVVNLDVKSDWELLVALENLPDSSTTARAAKAILHNKLEEPEKAWAILLDMWPERESELLDADNFYDLDYSMAALELITRLARQLDRQKEFIRRSNDKSLAASALANAMFADGDASGLTQFLSSTEHEVDFRAYYEAYCNIMTDPDNSAAQIAAAITWIDDNSGDGDDWPDLDFVWAAAPLYGDSWELRYSLIRMAIDAGIVSDVWDDLSVSQQSMIASEDLRGEFSDATDREQVAQLLHRVAGLDTDLAKPLQYELEARLQVLDGNGLDAAKAAVAQLCESDYHYRAVEDSVLEFLAEIGLLDLAPKALAFIDDESRSEQYEDWIQLARDLKQRDGSSVLRNEVLENLSWNRNLTLLELLGEAEVLEIASEKHPVTTGLFEAPSVLLALARDWSDMEAQVVEKLASWNRTHQTRSFPGAVAAWTTQTEAGRWVAAVYDDIPPGLLHESIGTTDANVRAYLLVANFPTPATHRPEVEVHQLITSHFSDLDSITQVYTPSKAVSWPADNWSSAIAQYIENGKIDIRWTDYRDGWRENWLEYAPKVDTTDEESVFNFGGIVETIPRELVIPSGDANKPKDADSVASPPSETYRLLQPSISFPPIQAGLHVQ